MFEAVGLERGSSSRDVSWGAPPSDRYLAQGHAAPRPAGDANSYASCDSEEGCCLSSESHQTLRVAEAGRSCNRLVLLEIANTAALIELGTNSHSLS